MKVSVVGTGYVGLVTGTCFAEIGHHVTCIDIDAEKIKNLQKGISPIFEPGLEDLLLRNIKSGRLSFSNGFESVAQSDFVFLAVGTPSKENGEADLSYLKKATQAIAPILKSGSIVVIKSTVPVMTWLEIKKLISQHTSSAFSLVSNPEFLKEGSAIDDFMKPDRVVVGLDKNDDKAWSQMEELYAPLVRQGNPIIRMSNISAETTKYAANCLLATKISFINEMSRLCDSIGADIEEVRDGITSDRRIGKYFLYPGPGYGGSCFPKDVKALIHSAGKIDLNLKIIQAVEEVNKEQKIYLFKKMMKHFNHSVKGKTFAFWGVAFKPNTDDVRESPAIDMANKVIENGGSVHFFDPEGTENFLKIVSHEKVKSFTNKYDCIDGCDGLVVLTEWPEFRAPDFVEISKRLKSQVIFDGRNLFKTSKVLAAGFKYYAIGKHIE